MSTRTRRAGVFFGAALALLGPEPGGAQLVPSSELPVRFVLKNGLEVILSEDSTLPVAAVVVAYRVGSVHEPEGQSGLVYLLEKLMMDAGGETLGPFQHRNTIIRAGGVLNAEAFEDRTVFYETIPSHLLALTLWQESERMRSLVITGESFERTRVSLLEELRERRFTEPYLPSLFALDQLLYADSSYSRPLLGSEADVRRLTLQDVRDFGAAAFVPGNAVLVVAGQFDVPRTRDLVARYFESIPRGRELPPVAADAAAWTRRRWDQTYEEPLVSTPALYVAFRILPPRYPEDANILTVLDYVLLRGRAALLPRRLLNRDAKIAYQVGGGLERRLDRMVFKIFVTASPSMIPSCRNAIFAELEKLRRNFLPVDALDRAKNLYRADLQAKTSTATGRALFLADEALALAMSGRTVEALSEEQAQTMAVSPKDIVGVMNRHFTVDNAIVLHITRK
ncbi:MAG: insulinase family protein [Candidatus Aminicenantes bacterium]|nr:insulinase family protein [Candidatus Aminicenantes bacterium]